jgi:hypothetical protein
MLLFGTTVESNVSPQFIQILRYFRLETLKEHMQVAQPEGLNELQRIAVRYENFIYTTADTKVI